MTKKQNSMDAQLNQMPLKGSLGILAYGDIAIRAWKKVKRSKGVSIPTKKKNE